MDSDNPAALTLDFTHHLLDEQSLRGEVESLQAAITEANEERAQAAEYGLVLLSEKQALRRQYDELSGLYESTKRELENSVNAIKQVQTDYEKRLKEVETQREQLLDEMESRETTLIGKVDKLGEEIRQLERKLKQSTSEQEHLNGHNTFLNAEVDRQRRECDVLREENRRLRQEQSATNRDTDLLKKDIEKLEKRIEKLFKFEEECSTLQEMNQSLVLESESIQHQYEIVLTEKDELESQTKQVLQALNEEREAKTVLEAKLQEEDVRSPPHPSWAVERESVSPPPLSNAQKLTHNRPKISSPAPREGSLEPNMQSTPYSPKKVPSLLSELQSSFMGNVDSAEMESLQQRCKEAENTITSLQKEKLVLEEKISSFSLERTETLARIDSVKEEYAKAISERDTLISSLKEDVLVKEEAIGRLRNRLNSTAAEKASKEIEADGLKDELQHKKELLAAEMEKMQKEHAEEQAKNAELRGEVSGLEEQLVSFSNTVEKLENIIFSSQAEVSSMTDDLRNLHKTVVTLGNENKRGEANDKLSPPPPNDPSEEDADELAFELTNDENQNPFYSIELAKKKTSVSVHQESQSLFAIVQLHHQLRSMRLPLEHFTKTMLEKSLAHSAAKRVPSDPTSPVPTGAKKSNLELEASITKWKAKLAHKNEEISNLRAIMKARSTTTDVAISSLRSKLEGQARAYQTEVLRLKHQLKMQKKEKDEQLSLRNMYAKRCDDYTNEITKLKRDIETKTVECDDMMMSLKKTIQRKLELATELEEYRVEQERVHLIPKLLGSSRI